MIGSIYKYYKNVVDYISKKHVVILFGIYKVKYCNDFITRGIPWIRVYKGGNFTIGENFKMNNGFSANVIGRQQKCIFSIKGKLKIKNNVGISSTAIICHKEIIIGNNVLIGGNTVIYDTDFHSLDLNERTSVPEIIENVKTALLLFLFPIMFL